MIISQILCPSFIHPKSIYLGHLNPNRILKSQDWFRSYGNEKWEITNG